MAAGAAFLVAGLLALVVAAPASAKVFGPGKNRAFHGVSDTGKDSGVPDFRRFERQVRSHPAVLQMFFHWGVPLTSSGALHRWWGTDTRGVLSLSTAPGSGDEVITPGQIANGRGDHYIMRLKNSIANARQTVYIRLMPEMNGHWNPYSAYNANGTRRDGKGPRAFKRAWRRFTIIMRGVKRNQVNKRLQRMGMPRIYRVKAPLAPNYKRLGVPTRMKKPRISMMWVPQTISSPNVRGNQPGDYWPGARYVDWVGADIFSGWATPGVWNALDRFFSDRRWHKKPFMIGEYSPYDDDHSGTFVRRLFSWERQRQRVKMLIYYRSVNTTNPHNLQHYPGARRSLRRILNSSHYRKYAPGVRNVPRYPPPD